MDAEPKRKQVNPEQLTALLEFLKEHEDLAKGLAKGRYRRGKLRTVMVWNQCAKKLNGIKDGVVKDGKGWSKYWCDWKYRVRRRALELKVAQEGDKPLTEGLMPLTSMEESIMSILGENAVKDVVIMNDPLSEGGLDEAIQNFEEFSDKSSINKLFDSERLPTNKRKRRYSNYSNESGADEADAGPSSSRQSRPSVDADDNDHTDEPKVKGRKKKSASNNLGVEPDDGSRANCPPEPRENVFVVDGNEPILIPDCEADLISMFMSLERQKIVGNDQILEKLDLLRVQMGLLASTMQNVKDVIVKFAQRARIPYRIHLL